MFPPDRHIAVETTDRICEAVDLQPRQPAPPMLEMLLDRQGESEQVRDELIGASLSHVASLRQPRGGCQGTESPVPPSFKVPRTGGSALWSRKFESLPARSASPDSALQHRAETCDDRRNMWGGHIYENRPSNRLPQPILRLAIGTPK